MAAVIEEHAEIQVFDEISLIEHGVRTAITRALPVGLTYPQYEVLNLIVRRGGDLLHNAIATALRMTPGTITNTLQRLETTKLVAVEVCSADLHKKLVSLTPQGR